MRIFAALVVWIAAVAAAAGLSSAVAGSIHDTPTTTNSGSTSSSSSSTTTSGGSSSGPTPTAPFDASSVKATDSDSLFQAANLGRALSVARLRYGSDAKVSNFALYPGYLSMTVEQANAEEDFYIAANGSSNANNTGASPGGQAAFKLSKVQADAPALIAARIAGHSSVPEGRLTYFVARPDPISGHFQWLAYATQGGADQYFELNGSNPSRSPLFAYTGSGLVRIAG